MAAPEVTTDANTELKEDIDMIPNPIHEDDDDGKTNPTETVSPQKPITMDIDFNSEAVQLQLAEIDSKKPPRSAYMLYAKTLRQEDGFECAGGVAAQARKIGGMWSALSEQTKEEWNQKVVTAKEEFDRFLDEHPEHRKLMEAYAEYKKRKSQKVAIPVATIKKIVSKDPDINRISKESLLMINHCASLFVQELVKTTNEQQTAPRKSKTITEKDLVNTFHSNNKYMFIRHVFKKNKHALLGTAKDQNHNRSAKTTNTSSPATKKARMNPAAGNTNSIQSFFNKK